MKRAIKVITILARHRKVATIVASVLFALGLVTILGGDPLPDDDFIG